MVIMSASPGPIATVKPLIVDPPRKGHNIKRSLYKEHCLRSQKITFPI